MEVITIIKQLYSKKDIRRLILINFLQRAAKIIISLTDAYFVQTANSKFLGLISIGDALVEVLYIISAMSLEAIAVFVSKFVGAKKIGEACKYIQVMYSLGVLSSITLAIVMLIGSRGIITFMYPNLSLADINSVVVYLYLSTVYLFFTFFYDSTLSVLHVLGKVKVNFILMMILSTLNTLSDVILFKWLDFEIEGAAISTTIAYSLCATVAVIMLFHYLPELRRTKLPSIHEAKKIAYKLISVGLPIAIEDRAVSVGNNISKMILCKYAANYLSLISVFNKFTTVMLLGVNSTCSTITAALGRCYGAKDSERFDRTYKYIKKIFFSFGYGWATLITIVLFFVSKLYGFCNEYLKIMRGLLLLHLITIFICAFFRYFLIKCLFVREKTLVPGIYSVIGNIVGRIVVPLLICPIMTYPVFGIRVGASIEWLVCAILTYIYYILLKRKLKQFI